MAGELNYKAGIDISSFTKTRDQIKKDLADLAKAGAAVGTGGFSTKPLTAYQAEMIKIKQQKLEQDRIDKQTSLATQAALREEARIRREQLAIERALKAEQSKKKTEVSNSQAEVDAYNSMTNGSKSVTSALNEQDKAQAKVASSAAAVATTTNQAASAGKSSNLTREQSNRLIAEEKYRLEQSNKELKNSVREQMNAKGSLEQRRAALIRLNTAYDRLSASERATPAGQRLQGIVKGLSAQVLDLEVKTNRAQRNVGNYTNAFAKGAGKVWSGLKLIANILPGLGIAGLLAFAIDPLMDYLRTLDLFNNKLKDVQKTAINSSEYKDAVTNVTALKVSVDEYHKGQITGKVLVDRYNDSIGKTAGLLKTTTEVENFYNSQSANYLKAIELRARANAALQVSTENLIAAQERSMMGPSIMDYAKAGVKSLGKALSGQGDTNWDQYLRDVNLMQAEGINSLNKKGKEGLALYEKLQKEADAFNKKNGFGELNGNKAGKVATAELNARNTLQAKIDELTKKGTDKILSANEQEVEAAKDKYRKLREEAIKFNNDPVNKRKGLKVDASGLVRSEKQEIDTIVYKQGTSQLKSDLDRQKQLYTEYEDFKTKVGEEKANDRYQSQLNLHVSYLELLQQKEQELTNKGILTGPETERLKVLQSDIKEELSVQGKKYNELASQFISYADKRKALGEQLENDLLMLGENSEAKAMRTEAYQEELDALDDANAKKLDSFKALFEGVDRLSDENARKVVSDAEDMLNALMASGKISQELAKEIRTLLGNTKREIAERMPERIINLANQIDRVAEAVSGVDEGFGKLLGTVGNVVGQVGNIKKGMLELKDAQGRGDALGQLSAGLGIFGAAFSAFKSISNVLGADLRANAEQQSYARDLQNKQIEAINKALERQISLINEAYGTDRIKEYTAALAQADADQKKFQEQLKDRYVLSGDKKTDDVIKLFNSGGTLPGFSRDFMKKSFAAMGLNTLPQNLDELQRLLDQGKLDEQTALIVNNLVASAEAAKELANNLKAETIGSSLDNIADDFISALTDGTQDFGKTFEDTIRKSILNGFKGKLIQQQLQGFYDDFAKATSDNNLSESEIEALRKTYLAASEKAKKDLEALATATGIDLINGENSNSGNQNSLQGAIKAITQDQANVLTSFSKKHYIQIHLKK